MLLQQSAPLGSGAALEAGRERANVRRRLEHSLDLLAGRVARRDDGRRFLLSCGLDHYVLRHRDLLTESLALEPRNEEGRKANDEHHLAEDTGNEERPLGVLLPQVERPEVILVRCRQLPIATGVHDRGTAREPAGAKQHERREQAARSTEPERLRRATNTTHEGDDDDDGRRPIAEPPELYRHIRRALPLDRAADDGIARRDPRPRDRSGIPAEPLSARQGRKAVDDRVEQSDEEVPDPHEADPHLEEENARVRKKRRHERHLEHEERCRRDDDGRLPRRAQRAREETPSDSDLDHEEESEKRRSHERLLGHHGDTHEAERDPGDEEAIDPHKRPGRKLEHLSADVDREAEQPLRLFPDDSRRVLGEVTGHAGDAGLREVLELTLPKLPELATLFVRHVRIETIERPDDDRIGAVQVVIMGEEGGLEAHVAPEHLLHLDPRLRGHLVGRPVLAHVGRRPGLEGAQVREGGIDLLLLELREELNRDRARRQPAQQRLVPPRLGREVERIREANLKDAVQKPEGIALLLRELERGCRGRRGSLRLRLDGRRHGGLLRELHSPLDNLLFDVVSGHTMCRQRILSETRDTAQDRGDDEVDIPTEGQLFLRNSAQKRKAAQDRVRMLSHALRDCSRRRTPEVGRREERHGIDPLTDRLEPLFSDLAKRLLNDTTIVSSRLRGHGDLRLSLCDCRL